MEEYGIEYRKKLEEMGRLSLFKEANKMRKRLNKLSGICNVEDVYKAYIEQSASQKIAEARKRESNEVRDMIFSELKKKHVTYGPNYVSLKDAVQLLIDSINQ